MKKHFILPLHLGLQALNIPIKLKSRICSKISLIGGLNPIDIRLPWICYEAIWNLEAGLERDMKVFEYGCGGSTLFFADRGCSVISVEHNPEWYSLASSLIRNHNNASSVDLQLQEPERKALGLLYQDETVCTSFSPDYFGFNFADYVKSILKYPDNYFDIVLVDGRARRSCIFYSIPKVKPGGLLVLDNTERTEYLGQGVLGLDKFELECEFKGRPPGLAFESQCMVWKKPDAI